MPASALEITREISFSAAVHYQDRVLGAQRSAELYGALAEASGWGCNYRLSVSFRGAVDPLTGMIVNLVDIDRWLAEVVAPLDGRILNDVSDFAGRVPTAERLVLYLYGEIKKRAAAGLLVSAVSLREGDEVTAVYRPV